MPPVKAPRPPRRRRRSLWPWLVVALIIVTLLPGDLWHSITSFAHSTTETRSFTVDSHPTLVLTDLTGNVHISSGNSNQVTIVAHKHTWLFGNSDQIHLHYRQDSATNTITVSVDGPFDFTLFGNQQVDFDVTVPNQADLSVHIDSGSINEDGVNGTLRLNTDSGSIAVEDSSGTLDLTTDSGSIFVNHIRGVADLHTDSGSIAARDASLSGQSSLRTDSGSIQFRGSLDRNGTYLFQTDSGSIDLTLPGNTNMQVHASTDSGSIHSDFPGIQSQRDEGGSQANGSTGGPPYAQVNVETDSGSIDLHAGA